VIWLAVAAAGAAGAVCRYLVDYAVTASSGGLFPWGTLAVNVTGATLIGLTAGLVTNLGAPSTLKTVAGAGFCGAYTTFSTLVHETWRLIEDRAYTHAAANLASLVLGLPAAALGWAATTLW
jgi:fluoride exporter